MNAYLCVPVRDVYEKLDKHLGETSKLQLATKTTSPVQASHDEELEVYRKYMA